MPAVLDTHAAIWYLLDTKNLSETVFSLIERGCKRRAHVHFSRLAG
jgi:PIN domain nuclease of toxin-antitoxin system